MDGQVVSGGLKTARILQWVVAICYILIGLLHTDVHFRELASEAYGLELSKIQGLELMGQEANVWKLWQGFSLAMGGCFVIVGLLNVSVLLNSKGQFLPLSFLFIMLLMLLMGAVSGGYYFGSAQLYGGMFGLALQSVAIVLTVRST